MAATSHPGGKRTVRILALVVTALVGCSNRARPAAVPPPLEAPTTPIPPSMSALGSPCTGDTATERSPGMRVERGIDTVCGAGGRVAIVVLWGYTAITGIEVGEAAQLGIEAPRFPLEGPVHPPPKILGVITLARERPHRAGRSSADEITVYADGYRLWVRGIASYLAQFATAALTIADRRYLRPQDVQRIRGGLGIPDDVPLDDDDAIAHALKAVPSLAPGRSGEIPGRFR